MKIVINDKLIIESSRMLKIKLQGYDILIIMVSQLFAYNRKVLAFVQFSLFFAPVLLQLGVHNKVIQCSVFAYIGLRESVLFFHVKALKDLIFVSN